MRPLFGPRTVVEAAFLVAVPVIALVVGLRWYAIVPAGAAAYLLVLAVEATDWRESKRGAGLAAAVAPGPAISEAPESPRLASVPEPEPGPVRVPVIEAEAVPEPTASAAVARIGGPRQWNVWDLERIAQEHAGRDPGADEERMFLLRYLRDFAGADGLLPADFDDLVRQSFGELVGNL